MSSVVMEVDVNCNNPTCKVGKVSVQIHETQMYWTADCPECGKNIIKIKKIASYSEDYKRWERFNDGKRPE